jgi:hypothetical protein
LYLELVILLHVKLYMEIKMSVHQAYGDFLITLYKNKCMELITRREKLETKIPSEE